MKDELLTKQYEGQDIYIQCCECRRYKTKDGIFLHIKEDFKSLVSHTYCNFCFDRLMNDLGVQADMRGLELKVEKRE